MKDPQLATQPVMITASLQLRCQLPFFILIFFFTLQKVCNELRKLSTVPNRQKEWGVHEPLPKNVLN